MDANEVYPFEVSVWVKTDPSKPPSFLGKAFWMEMARCRSLTRATEVAECLHIRHRLVRVSELRGDRFIPVRWYPDEATVEQETKQQ
jgi:hypothetical protein